MISSGGDPNPPVWSRVLWATLEGSIAAALILVGGAGGSGLSALQTTAILVAAPFSIVMILMAVATAKELLAEHGEIIHGRRRRFRTSLVEEIREELEAARPRRPGARRERLDAEGAVGQSTQTDPTGESTR